MILFKKAKQLTDYINSQRKEGKKIGFVPTMGALHEGHLSLITTSVKENDVTVCSIFVNPTQFNNPDDLKHYPVSIEKDIEQLLKAKCSVLLLPSEPEIYPAGHKYKKYELGYLEHILEGRFRPGHFQGVCQVMDRLLEIVGPDVLYLGQKDYQQCMVIKKLLQLTGRENEIAVSIFPTKREEDGLAMSSRNLRLDAEQRRSAPTIFETLNFIKKNVSSQSFEQLKESAKNNLLAKGFYVDYVEIADATTLQTASTTAQPLVSLIAASIGTIRLIDNLLLN